MYKKIVGENIKKYRKQSRFSQPELAKELNISSVSVSKWEQGLNSPSLETLAKISKILGISTLKLLEGFVDVKEIGENTLSYILNEDEKDLLRKLKSILNKLDI